MMTFNYDFQRAFHLKILMTPIDIDKSFSISSVSEQRQAATVASNIMYNIVRCTVKLKVTLYPSYIDDVEYFFWCFIHVIAVFA